MTLDQEYVELMEKYKQKYPKLPYEDIRNIVMLVMYSAILARSK